MQIMSKAHILSGVKVHPKKQDHETYKEHKGAIIRRVKSYGRLQQCRTAFFITSKLGED